MGFLWPIEDVINGNENLNRKPVHDFIREVHNYPGLLDIIISIAGIVNKRSQHASGVILYNETPFETTALMRSPSGDLTTQFSLHDAEKLGDTKFDFLVTEVSDKIIQTIKFLQKNNRVESNFSIREIYNKYLHPEKINLEDSRIWDALGDNAVMSAFQFDSPVGAMAARLVKPRTVSEMSAANSLMRLMAEKGAENPLEKYVRFKNNISLWYDEMNSYGLSKEEIQTLEKYYKKEYGVPPFQESIMLTLMDSNVCNFSLKESNNARKTVAKKQMKDIPKLKELVMSKAASERIGRYVWDTCVAPQLGYGFSELHSLAYSFVGVQTLYLATNFPSIYWNTACLVVNAGINEDEEEFKDLYEKDEEEDIEDDDSIEQNLAKKRVKSTDYAKLATAMSMILANGITISKPDINKSRYDFEPDEENNQILFGLSCMTNIGKDLVKSIEDNRPYLSIEDFMDSLKVNKRAMLSLIKGGAFDSLYPDKTRVEIMIHYIHLISDEKKKLTLQNFNGLIEKDLIPEELSFIVRVYQYTKILKKHFKHGTDFILNNEQILSFYEENFDKNLLKPFEDSYIIDQKVYDKQIYQKQMDIARAWLKKNHDFVLEKFNEKLFNEEWKKDASGTISGWEMDSISFYYHEHELAHVDLEKYGISVFSDLPVEPEIDYTFRKGNVEIPIYKLTRIIGTVISKDKTKSTINLLTTSGVATIRFRKEVFAIYDKQISEKQDDGKKKIIERSWFKKGNKLMITGYRREDQFVPKKYAKTSGHTLYLIEDVNNETGEISLRYER